MKRFWILLGALAVTLAALSIAMLLGATSFDFRRYTQHESRLRKVMREAPTADRLTRGLATKAPLLIAAPASREEAEQRDRRSAAGEDGRAARQDRPATPQLRVFARPDMLYFVFFDADGVMRDFTCVSR